MRLSKTSQSWSYPTKILFGCGLFNNLGKYCQEINVARPLLVIDPGLGKLEVVDRAIDSLNKQNICSKVFRSFNTNPDDIAVTDGVRSFHQDQHDGIIAIGGGSTIDVGKAIAFMAGQSRPIFDFEDKSDWWQRANKNIYPIISVPTTAGTGSEVGRAAVISDSISKQKKLIFHPNMMPKIALLDAELTLGLSQELTAATGMDALIHNLEAYLAIGIHPIADGVALEGLKIIYQNFENVIENGSNLDARCGMLIGSTMGAIAFQKGLGGVHALAHPVGSLFNTHHGLTNAILLPYVIAYNFPKIKNELSNIARYLDLNDHGPKALIEWLLKLRKKIGIPNTLQALGPTKNDIDQLTALALIDPAAPGNPRPLSKEIISNIYKNSLDGNLIF